MRNPAIRFRLTVWYSLALTAGLILFAFAIFFSLRHSLIGELDSGLAGRAQRFSLFLRRETAGGHTRHLREELEEFSGGLPAGTFVRITDAQRNLVMTSNTEFPFAFELPSGGKARRVRWRGHNYRVVSERMTQGDGSFDISVADSLDAIEAVLSRLRWLLVLCIPPVILAAALGGNWLSRRALRPVDDITMAAQSVGIANLSERLTVPQTGDELQRLAETWNGMLARLEGAVKRLSRFTADASHELRTPLAVIRMTAEIASRRARSSESYQESLGQIVAESERMTQLVDDLLYLARCDSDSTEMPMETLDLGAAVEEACCHARPLAGAKSISIWAEPPEGNISIAGNDLAIRRLLLVLLDNAIKYSPAGTDVRVRLRAEEMRAVLEIRDRGVGIPAGDLPHIFERFYRARQNGAETTPGYGLGLSLASGIAERHGAKIEAASGPEQGSTFRVTFPGA